MPHIGGGLDKVGSSVVPDVNTLDEYKDPKKYKKEIIAERPSNLRKWSTDRRHHSRVLAGIRICQTPNGQTVQLGLLDPSGTSSKYIQPQQWIKFDTSNNEIGQIGGYNLKIGGWVVVRD